jgi:hypothetical protein
MYFHTLCNSVFINHPNTRNFKSIAWVTNNSVVKHTTKNTLGSLLLHLSYVIAEWLYVNALIVPVFLSWANVQQQVA